MREESIPNLAMYAEDDDWKFNKEIKGRKKEFFDSLRCTRRDKYATEYEGIIKLEFKNLDNRKIAVLLSDMDCFGGSLRINRDTGSFEAKLWND